MYPTRPQFRVTCVRKLVPGSRMHEHITDLAGPAFYQSRGEVVTAINARYADYYTEEAGVRAYLEVRKERGNQFVQTKPDGVWDNNLTALPECSDPQRCPYARRCLCHS